jgi:uncharacterized membrane protein YeaQ/YmgE (transglycosylase-associated protein family)
MDGIDIAEVARLWAHDVLLWIGFGTVVGLLARLIMPGRDRAGAFATVLMGIGGAVIGSGVLSYIWAGHRVTPVSLVGFGVSLLGAFLLLFFHRLLGGYIFREGVADAERPARPPRRRTPPWDDEE